MQKSDIRKNVAAELIHIMPGRWQGVGWRDVFVGCAVAVRSRIGTMPLAWLRHVVTAGGVMDMKMKKTVAGRYGARHG